MSDWIHQKFATVNSVLNCWKINPVFFRILDEGFSFQNNAKNLDPSYKTDLDLWDCLGRVKFVS